jgi:hypothetical protein
MTSTTEEASCWEHGRWVVLHGFTTDEDFEKTHLNGLVAKILEEDGAMDDRYLVQVPATDDSDHIKEREFTVDKAHLIPVSAPTELAMQVGSPAFCDETGEVIPCYEHWTQVEQDKLTAHIAAIEQYNQQWARQQQQQQQQANSASLQRTHINHNSASRLVPGSPSNGHHAHVEPMMGMGDEYNEEQQQDAILLPQLPEWYLYSLRASLRKWGTIPADYAETPPLKNAHERCIHIEPRGNGKSFGGSGSVSGSMRDIGAAASNNNSNNYTGEYRFLEVTIVLKNQKWKDRDRAMLECITIVKNTVLGVDDRATLVHFEALSGGYPGPACEDTTAVFAVTKDFASKFLPLTVVKPVGSPPQVNLRMY